MSEIPIYRFALREDLKDEKRFLPTRAEPKASGWDVRAAMQDKKPLLIKPFDMVKIPLGVRGFCPDGWWYDIKPRSSSFTKKNLHALYGTIDETYEGELVFACQYIPEIYINTDIEMKSSYYDDSYVAKSWICGPDLIIEFGDAIAQIIPRLRQEMIVEDITNEHYDNSCKTRAAVRGAGGFGSTGK